MVERAHREVMAKLKILRRAIGVFNNPALWPHDGKTFCNIALDHFALLFGVREFNGILANTIHAHLLEAPSWRSSTAHEALNFAFTPGLVVATLPHQPHGHVAAVLPIEHIDGQADYWKGVPVLSMGHAPGIGVECVKVFHAEPSFWVYLPSLTEILVQGA